MKLYAVCLLCCLLSGCRTTRYYIVRHAEKEAATAMMLSDVPLSEKGMQRAEALKEILLRKKIGRIFSTNYNRTRATAQPLSAATGVRIESYDLADSAFIPQLKRLTHGTVLIVGHSNTVDDLVNGLTGKIILQDLPDAQYGDLFLVKKRGNSYRFSKSRFGR
jgi:phosphohistidine phosphatase SixA